MMHVITMRRPNKHAKVPDTIPIFSMGSGLMGSGSMGSDLVGSSASVFSTQPFIELYTRRGLRAIASLSQNAKTSASTSKRISSGNDHGIVPASLCKLSAQCTEFLLLNTM